MYPPPSHVNTRHGRAIVIGNKPKLILVGTNLWACVGFAWPIKFRGVFNHSVLYGYGATPTLAYRDWQNKYSNR